MLHIESSTFMLFGKQVTFYAAIHILAAICITVVNGIYSKKRGMDSSFAVRISALVFFGGSIGILFMGSLPKVLLPVSFMFGSVCMTGVFWGAARIFKRDSGQMTELAVCSCALFSFFSRLGCFLTGCCYGVEYHGVFSVVYGSETLSHVPNTSRFPSQLLTSVIFLVLAAFAYRLFLKRHSRALSCAVLFADIFVYYLGTWLSDSSANQMIIGGFDFSIPFGIASLFCTTYFVLKFLRNQRFPKGVKK